MQKIKIETSLGICEGFIATPETLEELAKDSDFVNYIDSDGEIYWHAPQDFPSTDERELILFDQAATELFQELGLEAANFYLDNGWVKAELSDPSYGAPEWKDMEPIFGKIIDHPCFSDVVQKIAQKMRAYLVGSETHEHIAPVHRQIPKVWIVEEDSANKKISEANLNFLKETYATPDENETIQIGWIGSPVDRLHDLDALEFGLKERMQEIDWDTSHLKFNIPDLPTKAPTTKSRKRKGRRGDIK